MADWKSRATDITSMYVPPKAASVVSDSSTPSSLEALLRGGAQGASLGFSDEIQGALQALNQAGSPEGSFSNIGDYYSQERDKARAANKAAEEAHPLAYFGGNIGGGLLLPGGIIGKGAAEATGLTKAAILAAEGAGVGGAAGLGSSESGDISGMAKDTAQGAALGSVLSPFLGQVLPGAVKGTGGFLKSFGPVSEASDVFASRMAGNPSLRGKEALQREAKNMRDLVSDQLLPTLGKGVRDIKNQAYADAFATQVPGDNPSIVPLIEKARQQVIDGNLDPEEAKKVLAILERFARKGEDVVGFKQTKGIYTNPEEARAQDFVNKIKAKQDIRVENMNPSRVDSTLEQVPGQAFGTPMAKVSNPDMPDLNVSIPKMQGRGEFSKIEPITGEVFNQPEQSLQKLTELKTQLEDYAQRPDSIGRFAQDLKRQVDELITSKIDPNSYEFANKMQNLQSEIQSKFGVADIGNNSGPTASDRQWMENKTKQLADTFKKISGGKDPQEAQRISEGFNALKQMDPSKGQLLEREMEDQARKYYLSSSMNKEGTPVFGKSPLSVLSSAKGIALGASDIAGGIAKSLLDSTPGQLGQAASELAKRGQTRYAQMLREISLAPNDKRKALIFTLSQNPDFRKVMSLGDE